MLVDLFMPDVDGPAVIAQLRGMLGPVPVIAMSGAFPRGNADTRDEHDLARELGATAVMHKPFRPGELIATIEQALAR